MINPFFKNRGPFKIDKLLNSLSVKNENLTRLKVSDIKNLSEAKKNDITFFHSKKYELLASKTKASFCITTKSLANILPFDCKKIIVKNCQTQQEQALKK